MYVGRDMTELSMMPKSEWDKSELAFFHHSLQQMAPYLNSEGVSIHREIIEEIENRGGLNRDGADYEHGTKLVYD
jgi:hypothetical protein